MERQSKSRITPTSSSSSSTIPSSSFLSLPPKPQPDSPCRLSRRLHDSELSIFDAKRYFNDSSPLPTSDQTQMPPNQRAPSVSSLDGNYYANKYRTGSILTPAAASSEASWNSQSALLPRPPGSVTTTYNSPTEKPKLPPSPGRRFFSFRCPCVGQKSLQIDGKLSEPKSPICAKSTTNQLQGSQTELDDSTSSVVPLEALTKVRISSSTWSKDRDFIRSPALFPPKAKAKAKANANANANAAPPFPTEIARTITKPIVFSLPDVVNKATKPTIDEPPRDSIEVFGTRRVTAPPARIILKADEEELSDASSDLFELDSFTTNSFGATSYGRRRDSLDDLLDPRRLVQLPPGIKRNFDEAAQSECCYPPSEVSVQWSVTTAEGFDRASVANFSSAASEFGEAGFIQAERARIDKRKAASGGGTGGGLLSCRGDKAVQVRCNSGRANRTVK